MAQLEQRLAPFVDILRTLRRSFPRLMLHGLPPRGRDDDRAVRWSFGAPCAAAVRAKLTLAANRYLAAACAAIDVAFIDIYDQLSLDGYLRPEFDLDGLHIGRAATEVSLKAVTANLFDRTGPTAHPLRYARALELSPVYDDRPLEDQAGWAEGGYVVADLGGRTAAEFEEPLRFIPEPRNTRACPEWVGHPRAGRAGIAMAEPSRALVERAARLLCTGAGRAALQVGEPKELTVTSFRPVELAAGRWTSAAVLPSPVGCRRAVLFLGGPGEFVLESVSGGVSARIPARSGSLIVCDSARVWCHLAAGDEAARFIEIALAPRDPRHPFRVIAAGLNEWPADPFHYPVAGMLAFPPFAGDLVHERG